MLAQDPVADERDRRLSRAVLPQGARRPPREPVGRVLVKTPRPPAVERLGGAARLPHARRDAREDILKLDLGARSVPSAAAAPARPTLVQELGRAGAVRSGARWRKRQNKTPGSLRRAFLPGSSPFAIGPSGPMPAHRGPPPR